MRAPLESTEPIFSDTYHLVLYDAPPQRYLPLSTYPSRIRHDKVVGVTVMLPLRRPNRLRQFQSEVCTNDSEQSQDQGSYVHIHTTPTKLQYYSTCGMSAGQATLPCKCRLTILLRLLKSLGATRACREVPTHLRDFYLRDQDARMVGAQKVVGAETSRSTKILRKDIQAASLDSESQKDRSQIYLISTLVLSSGLSD